jgi:hypothetical protein
MNAKELINIRREAEKAVSEMPQGELKIKAFEVMLKHLLTIKGGIVSENSKAPPRRAKVVGSRIERILTLKNEDYFREQRTIGEVREELAARGWHYPLTALSGPLQGLVQRRELRRQKMTQGKKKVWKYSNP